MHRDRAVLVLGLALWASACIDPKCPSGYMQMGDTCRRCRVGDTWNGNTCIGNSDASDPGDPDAAEIEVVETEPESDSGAEEPSGESELGEYALGAAGKSCPPQMEQTLACDGHASRRVLKCHQGVWTVLETCAQNERCDSRAGTDQGTCTSIAAVCSGNTAGDTCDGTERVTCGVDLVSVAPNPCPAHSHCGGAPSGQCECEAGYETSASSACIDVDECATVDLCGIAYPCTQTEPPGYVCLGHFADWPMPDAAPGAKFAPSYDTETAPGTVIDNVTGLMWQRILPGNPAEPDPWYQGCTGMRNVVGDVCTLPQAKRYCSDLVLADQTDWRLPSRIEIESILELSGGGSQINRDAFGYTPTDGFWSSSPYVGYAITQFVRNSSPSTVVTAGSSRASVRGWKQAS